MKLTIDEIEFSYNSTPVLNGLKFQVEQGEFVAILGPNGSGKSTLLRCIDRILKPKNGIVLLDEDNIETMNRKNIAKKLAYVPQVETNTFPTTVYDTILLGRLPHIEWMPTKSDKEIVTDIIEKLQLAPFTLRKTNQLSGGQRQKVFIGRALAQKAPILLLDEPTANLDLKHQLEVMALLREQTKQGVSIIIAIHDINLALKYCQKIILLKDGTIHAAGGKEIITEKNLEEVYEIKASITENAENIFVIPEESLGDKIDTY